MLLGSYDELRTKDKRDGSISKQKVSLRFCADLYDKKDEEFFKTIYEPTRGKGSHVVFAGFLFHRTPSLGYLILSFMDIFLFSYCTVQATAELVSSSLLDLQISVRCFYKNG